jgi:hypothetical protein
MGESMDVLMGSCSQNTLKNKKLELQSCRRKETLLIEKGSVERFIEGSRNQVPTKPPSARVSVYIYIYVQLLP